MPQAAAEGPMTVRINRNQYRSEFLYSILQKPTHKAHIKFRFPIMAQAPSARNSSSCLLQLRKIFPAGILAFGVDSAPPPGWQTRTSFGKSIQ
jgi:hypothetical protein